MNPNELNIQTFLEVRERERERESNFVNEQNIYDDNLSCTTI